MVDRGAMCEVGMCEELRRSSGGIEPAESSARSGTGSPPRNGINANGWINEASRPDPSSGFA